MTGPRQKRINKTIKQWNKNHMRKFYRPRQKEDLSAYYEFKVEGYQAYYKNAMAKIMKKGNIAKRFVGF